MSNLARAARVLTMLAAALTAAGCATVTRGSSQAWTVASEPSGATAQSSDGHSCPSTPCTWTLRRKSSFHVTITKPDYQTAETDVSPRVSRAGGTAFFGNVLIGGLIGMGVDAGTGAMLDLTPNPLVVKLEPRRFAAASQPYPASLAAPPPPAVRYAAPREVRPLLSARPADPGPAASQRSRLIGPIYLYDLWVPPEEIAQLQRATSAIRGVQQVGVSPTPSGAQSLMVAVAPAQTVTARLEIERLLGEFDDQFHRVQ